MYELRLQSNNSYSENNLFNYSLYNGYIKNSYYGNCL